MGVKQESMTWQRWVQLPASASQAFPAEFPSSGVATLDLFVRRAERNARRRSGPSVHPVHLGSSPVRFLIVQVQRHVGARPNPTDDIADYRILLVDQGQ